MILINIRLRVFILQNNVKIPKKNLHALEAYLKSVQKYLSQNRVSGLNLSQKKYVITKNMFPFCINLVPLYLKLILKSYFFSKISYIVQIYKHDIVKDKMIYNCPEIYMHIYILTINYTAVCNALLLYLIYFEEKLLIF